MAGIYLSRNAVKLNRWGDTVRITALPIDRSGLYQGRARITWSSADDTIAAVDSTGKITSWIGGNVDLTVEASLGDITVAETVTVTVAIQQNSNCKVPQSFPAKGPVNPPSTWDVQRIETQLIPEGTVGNMVHNGIPLSLDADRDGDYDLLNMTNTPENQGIEVPIYTAHALWLNDGNAVFTDGTDAILGQNVIPWSAPRRIGYADFDADGFRDIMVFQQGWEFGEDDGSCNDPACSPGGPNLLFLPQPGGLSDSAPTRLSPYDLNGFTHSGGVGDIDCDGDIDIFEPNWGGAGRAAIHNMQVNTGVGTFQTDVSLLPDELKGDVAVSATAMCDLDRDGDPDLVNSFPDTATPYVPDGFSADYGIRVSVNDGFGHYHMLDDEVLPPLFPWDSLDCADLDLNGYPDILMTGRALMNQGDMTFVLDVSSQYDTNRNGLGIVDFNNDGWPDLTPWSDYLYWNNGTGVFDSAPIPYLCCGAQSTVADFDSNGRPDIYVDLSNRIDHRNLLYLNQPPNPPDKTVFATSSLYTADLGGLAGADAVCQQHATDAGLAGTYVALLSDSNTDAINRISHGKFKRTGDGALISPSKIELTIPQLTNPVGYDEHGVLIVEDEGVRTGTGHDATGQQGAGFGFCSDWSRATDEDPGSAATGFVSASEEWWVWADDEGVADNCSEPLRLYCFQE